MEDDGEAAGPPVPPQQEEDGIPDDISQDSGNSNAPDREVEPPPEIAAAREWNFIEDDENESSSTAADPDEADDDDLSGADAQDPVAPAAASSSGAAAPPSGCPTKQSAPGGGSTTSGKGRGTSSRKHAPRLFGGGGPERPLHPDGTAVREVEDHDREEPAQFHECTAQRRVLIPDEKRDTPLHLFSVFFTDEVIDLMVQQALIYSREWKKDAGLQIDLLDDLDADMMRTFLGLLILMGLQPRRSIDEYWSNELVSRHVFISSVMSRNLFVRIYSRIHFVDNRTGPRPDDQQRDRTWKIAPLVNMVCRRAAYA